MKTPLVTNVSSAPCQRLADNIGACSGDKNNPGGGTDVHITNVYQAGDLSKFAIIKLYSNTPCFLKGDLIVTWEHLDDRMCSKYVE